VAAVVAVAVVPVLAVAVAVVGGSGGCRRVQLYTICTQLLVIMRWVLDNICVPHYSHVVAAAVLTSAASVYVCDGQPHCQRSRDLFTVVT
jgi:hypothetical protein